jgi:hypothetical protein
MRPTPTGTLDVSATEDGTNGTGVSEIAYPSATLQRPSNNASCHCNPWHLDGNHTTKQCYQLMRALKSTPEPPHPHDKKGKKKHDDGNGDFQ